MATTLANVHAEQNFLGAVMQNNSLYPEIKGSVYEATFTKPEHKVIWKQISFLANLDRPFDFVSVNDSLEKQDIVQLAGGIAYVGNLAGNALAANFDHYHKEICRLTADRKAQEKLDRLNKIFSEDGDEDEVAKLAISFADTLQQGKNKAADDRFKEVWFNDIDPPIDVPSLIHNVIQPESLIVSYGQSNSGKTFHVLHRDICLAANIPWYGRQCYSTGFVVYVAAEGPRSVGLRAAALRRENLSEHEGDIKFALIPSSINLLDPTADTSPLIDSIKRIEDKRGEPCIKLTVDTLSRSAPGGDENSSQTMGAIVYSADRIRQETGCAFEFVHHSGKDTTKGARGHSLLRAATDTEIEISNDNGLHIAKITKQRDLPVGDEYAFRLRVVEMGEDSYGNKVTTCVPELTTDKPTPKPKRLTGSTQKKMLNLLRTMYLEARNTLEESNLDPGNARIALTDWKARAIEEQVVRNRQKFGDQKAALLNNKVIHTDGLYVYVTE